MKRIVALMTVLALAGVAWGGTAGPGNVLRDEQYHNDWGYRDWQSYEGTQELADDYWGLGYEDDYQNISLRFTPGTNVTFDSVRLGWASGGSSTGANRQVTVGIESNAVTAANYHGGMAIHEPGYDPTPWGIPSGALVSPGTATMDVQAANMVVDFNVGVTNLVAGTTYHIRISVTPMPGNTDKLRLRCSNLYRNKSTNPINNNQNNNTNYRNADGVCGCNLTPGDTQVGFVHTAIPPAVGDDCMAVLHIKPASDPFGNPQPYNKWCEGQIWNDGIEDYAKYQEPRFELLYYGMNVLGQGTDSKSAVAVTNSWQGELFTVQATGAGCSPPDPNMPEEVSALRMYIKKATGETQNLQIALLDAAGNVLASGGRLASSIPDYYDVAADGVTPATDWGWVTVGINPIMLTPGLQYIVACKSAGTGYSFAQQNFDAGGLEINSSASSFQGTSGCAWSAAGGTNVSSDALFLVGVPEPTTLGLIALGGLALIRRRRR